MTLHVIIILKKYNRRNKKIIAILTLKKVNLNNDDSTEEREVLNNITEDKIYACDASFILYFWNMNGVENIFVVAK